MRCVRAIQAASFALAAAILCACTGSHSDIASIWTDTPELALAVELFNGSQKKFLAEIRWKEDLASALEAAGRPPMIAAGRWLKGSPARSRFRPLDYLFDRGRIDRSSFYKDILALGVSEGRQILIPLSFNLPAIVFAKGTASITDEFTLSLDDIASASTTFSGGKTEKGGFIGKMSFSPRWNTDFLVLAVDVYGAGFRTVKGNLAWDAEGLGRAIDAVRGWIAQVDGSAAAADDYQFKYLYTPSYQYLKEGRAQFAYMKSSDFFLIPEDKRSSLDYRWFSNKGRVPVSEEIVYIAMSREGRGREAAEAFITWLFSETAQDAILQLSKRTRTMESHFGLAGGFSTLRSVNEQRLVKFHPSLIGHLPPTSAFSTPPALPADWAELKSELLGPWLLEVTASREPRAEDAGAELASRLSEYRRRISQRP